MKILFIVPPYISYNKFIKPSHTERVNKKGDKTFGSIISDVPLGIISMSAYIKKYCKDIEVDLIDFNSELNSCKEFDYEDFAHYFTDYFLNNGYYFDKEYDIIGISCLFTTAYYNMIELGKILKNILPDSFIIAGGGIPTNMYKRIYEETDCFDALCYGEGEIPLNELVIAKDKKDYLRNTNCWITKDNINNKHNFSFLNNLDVIPFCDYDLCNINNYSKKSLQSLFPLMNRSKKAISYMTTRGCTNFCSFCSSHSVHGRKIREHSLERIERDLKILKEKYGMEVVTFLDDHFMYSKERVYKIVEILKKLKLKAFFPSSLALYALDKDILKALKSVGLQHLILSVESGSNRVLKKIMHKPLNLKVVQRVINDCNDLGISTDISILIGLPGETKKDIKDAEKFFETISPSWYRFSVATPLVGSEMFDICMKNNYFKGDYIISDFKTGVVKTEEFTPEWLQKKLYELNIKFNFINNNDMKKGNYSHALKEFENTIKVTDGKHAFAYYYASTCLIAMSKDEKAKEYYFKYHDIINKSKFWKNYAKKFNLEK